MQPRKSGKRARSEAEQQFDRLNKKHRLAAGGLEVHHVPSDRIGRFVVTL
jgi:hypothetical protein